MNDAGSRATRFDELYRTYHGRVRTLAARRFGESAADDIAQDVMMSMHRCLDQLTNPNLVWPWLAVVTRNAGVNQLRKTRRSVPMDLDELDVMVLPAPDVPAIAAVAGDTRRRLGRAMSRLPEPDRNVLQMREIDGLPIADIAARHGASAGAIRQRLFRARRVLAREYQAVGGERVVPPAWSLPQVGSAVRNLTDTAAALPGSIQEGTTAAIVAVVALVLAGTTTAAAVPSRPPDRSVPVSRPATGIVAGPALPGLPVSRGALEPPLRLDPSVPCPRHLHVAAGSYATLAVRRDGTAWTWFEGNTDAVRIPKRVSGLSGVTAAATGAEHFLALRADGTVWAWGHNQQGQLGDGTTTDRLGPVRVSGLSGVRAVAAGAYHSLAVKADGTVWTWGSGHPGQLALVDGVAGAVRASGSGHPGQPVRVDGIDGAVAVAAGAAHSVVVRGDGTVWTWGSNDAGQLGDGTTTARAEPVRVAGLDGVAAVAAGAKHSLAVKADGSVWAWGSNEDGQLGDGETIGRADPGEVPGLFDVKAVAANGANSLALKADATVWAWGSTIQSATRPKADASLRRARQVVGLSEVHVISAGDTHSMAVEADGDIRRWGDAVGEELGGLGCDQLTTPHVPALCTLESVEPGLGCEDGKDVDVAPPHQDDGQGLRLP